MKFLKDNLYLVLSILLGVILLLPLLQSGFFPVHDDTQIARVAQMQKSLSDGHFPVRWVDDLGYGYGYPIFNFYAPLAYYVGALFTFLGFTPLVSTKIMMGIGFLLASIGMYLFGKSVWGKTAGFVASVVYTYFFYHALNFYVRGAVAETWAYGLLPFLFWSLWELYKKEKLRYVIYGMLAYAGIILSHNLSAFLITPFYLVCLFLISLTQREWKKKIITFLPFIGGGTLSAFYSIPALFEMGYTNVVSQIEGKGSIYSDHFVCLSQFWYSPWGFGGSTQGCLDGISFQINKVILVAVLGSLVILLLKRNKESTKLLLVLVSFLFFSLFMMTEYSLFLWKLFDPLRYLQFPWRYFQIVGLVIALIIGGGVGEILKSKLIHKYLKVVGVLILVVFIIATHFKLFNPQFYIYDYRDESSKDVIRFTISSISDEYLPQSFIKPQSSNALPDEIFIVNSGDVETEYVEISTDKKLLKVKSSGKSQIRLNIAYFPAWEIVLDGKKIKPDVQNGLYIVELENGDHTIDINYRQTFIENVGTAISFISFLLLVLGIIKVWRRKLL